MKIKVTSTKKMTQKAWEEEEKPNWWIKCKDGSGMSSNVVGWGKLFPPIPGTEYLEVVINVDVRTKYVDIGCGKNKLTKIREHDIKITPIKETKVRR